MTLPPRPVFTCRCGRFFLDMFSFGKHYDECDLSSCCRYCGEPGGDCGFVCC